MQYLAQANGIKGLIQATGNIVGTLIGIVAGIALLVFFWGLARFLFRLGGDEKAVDEGKRIMKWGILALFIMISFAGIIGFFQRQLGLPNTTTPRGEPIDTPNINPFLPKPNVGDA